MILRSLSLSICVSLVLASWQVSPPIVAAVGAGLIAWLEGKPDTESAEAGVQAALRFVEEELQNK